MIFNEILLIMGMAAVTFGLRFFFFALGSRITFSAGIQKGLRYVPIAVLTAIATPMILLPDGQHWQFTWHNPWLIGSLGSALGIWLTRSLLLAIIIGLGLFFLWPLIINNLAS